MKKILTLFLCLAMVMAVLPIVPITVGAEEVDSSDMVTYEVSGNEAYVKTCDENAVGSVIIKSEYSDYPVTKIASWAFNGCSGLTSITIPDSVKSIDMWSFTGLNNLETIYVNSGNTNYYSSGNSVIETATKTLIIGTKNSVISDDGSVTSIGKNAFNGRTGLAKLTIPDSVTSIGDFSFCGCYQLTSITIPDGVTSIGHSALSGCSGLTSITIPENITSIGWGALSGCSGLESIYVENGNTKYHSSGNCLIETESKKLIAGCKNSIIPNDGSVTSIGSYTFSGCSGLTSITIPSSVTSIGAYAFYGCTGLTSITIPNSVTSIGGSAFEGCTGLTSITIPDSVTNVGWYAFRECSSLTSITIPDSVTSIGDYAFSRCSGLTSITIPDSVTSIGDYAFDYCPNLTIICEENSVAHTYAVENSIPYILHNNEHVCADGTWSFNENEHYHVCDICGGQFDNAKHSGGTATYTEQAKCVVCGAAYGEKLDYITYAIENGTAVVKSCDKNATGSIEIRSEYQGYPVTKIDAGVFLECGGIVSIFIPSSITSIGTNAIWPGMCAIECKQGSYALTYGIEKKFKFVDDNVLYSIVDNHAVVSGCIDKSVSNITIKPNYNGYNVEGFDDYAANGTQLFRGCVNLVSITIPNSITSIGHDAFRGCTGLTSVTIPDSVTYIGDAAFYECTGLTSLTMSNNIKSIGGAAFSFCTGLTSVTIPSSVTSIGMNAFCKCTNLSSITIQKNVTNIHQNAFFWDNPNLTDITVLSKEAEFDIPKTNTPVTLRCYSDSKMFEYAVNNNIPYILLDEVELGIAALTGASVDVDSTLTLNCFAKPDEGMTDAAKLRVKFTRNGKSVWSGGVLRDDGKYRFAYEGITPQCMADIISIELYYGENKIDEKKYSIKEYCDTVAASSTTSLNISAQQFAKLKTMLADMLTYGSKAQVFANYNTSTLADSSEWVSKWVSQYVKPENIKSLSGSGDGARIGGAGLILENTVKIYYNITTDDAENVTAVLKRNGVTVLEKKVSQLDKANGVYRFVSNGISARNFNDKFELELYKNGDMVHSCTYSVNSYIAVMDGNAAVGELIKALGSYGKSALDYVNG